MMKFEDKLSYAISSVKRRKLRTWLTLAGIIIGILTIVLIVSISDGVKKDITDQLDSFGSENLYIMPVSSISQGMSSQSMTSAPQAGKLFEKDADLVEKIPGVKLVSKMLIGKGSVEYKDTAITSPLYAVTPSMLDQFSEMTEIEQGRNFKENEKNVVILANDAANEMFDDNKLKVGSTILINGEKFRVVGILKKIGTSLSQSDDSAIYIPFDKGKEMWSNVLAKDEISFLYVQIEPGFDMNEIKEEIEFELASSHKVKLDEKDFSVITPDEIRETVGGILDLLSTFLLAISAIASIVSGVGIMNTMFMSIMERTREIGVMKAVGAKEKDILSIFIIESGILGGIGGVIGLIIGIIIAYLIDYFEIAVTVITPILAIGVLLFSIGIGVLAGFIPAKRAAKLNPVQALR